jgi:integrase
VLPSDRVPIAKHPGFYRRGDWVVFPYRDQRRRMKWGKARTVTEAKRVKAQLVTDVARGEFVPQSKVTVPDYGRGWVETYQGRTSKAIGAHTRARYRRGLEDAYEYFAGVRLSDVRPQDVKAFAAWVGKRARRRRGRDGKIDVRPLTEASVRASLAPVKAMFATAFEEGLIRMNPTAGVRIVVPRRRGAAVDEDEGTVKALTAKQLEQVLGQIAAADVRWILFFRVLVSLGLRISEAIELRWRDVDLGTRTVRIRRNFYGGEVGSLKTKYSRRDLKLAPELARALWTLRKETKARDGDLVFTSSRGRRVDSSNLSDRVMKPAAKKAGVEWVSFHTFRHTCASLLFNDAKWNPKQVQVWLGHHSPAFTLERYVHLLPADLPDPPALGLPVSRPQTEEPKQEEDAAAGGAVLSA